MAGFNGEKLIQTDSLESASEYTTPGLEETYLERAKREREIEEPLPAVAPGFNAK
jgi:hypothetical protein